MENLLCTESVDEHPVDKAARLCGGRVLMATSLGITVAAIGNWKWRNVPLEFCIPIERITGRLVLCEDLRPDVDWAYLRKTAGVVAADTLGAIHG